MIFSVRIFVPDKLPVMGNFLCILGLNTKETRQDDFEIFSLSLCSSPWFFSPKQSKQPVITPDQGTAWQTLRLFSQFLFVSLALQWGLFRGPFSGMLDVYGVTSPSPGFRWAHLQLLLPVLCKRNRIEHRNSSECSKHRHSSFQTLSFKDIIKPNSPNVVKDLEGWRCSTFCRW